MNGCKNEAAKVPLVHGKSTTGYTEIFWMKPFTCSLFLLSPRYFFFNQTKLSFSTFQTVLDFPLVPYPGVGVWVGGIMVVGGLVRGLLGFGVVGWVWLGELDLVGFAGWAGFRGGFVGGVGVRSFTECWRGIYFPIIW